MGSNRRCDMFWGFFRNEHGHVGRDHRICRGHFINANPAGRSFNLINGISDLLGSADRICGPKSPLSRRNHPGHHGGVLLQAINPKAYVVNTSLITGFGYMPDNLTLEIILKILITNAIWIPLHLGWLYAGTLLHELNLSQRTQSTINILMALSMLMVAFLAAAFAQGRAG